MSTETYQPGEIRDRSANERTLLAGLRTSVVLSGFGLALQRKGGFCGVMLE